MFRFMSFERTVNFVTEMKLFEFNLMMGTVSMQLQLCVESQCL